MTLLVNTSGLDEDVPPPSLRPGSSAEDANGGLDIVAMGDERLAAHGYEEDR